MVFMPRHAPNLRRRGIMLERAACVRAMCWKESCEVETERRHDGRRAKRMDFS
jgi:hypothetical protein